MAVAGREFPYGDWQGEGQPDDGDQPTGEPGVVAVRLRRVIIVAAPPPRM